MRHLLFIIVFLSSILTAGAQELRVKSFTPLPMDLTARKQQRLDLNGKPCAMLKIMVMDDITDCNKSNIGDIATSGVMKLVYLPSVVRSVTLNFKYHYPLTITFADYGVTKLEGSATYELRLVDALQMMMENGNAAQPVGVRQPSQHQTVNTQSASTTTTTTQTSGNQNDKKDDASNPFLLKYWEKRVADNNKKKEDERNQADVLYEKKQYGDAFKHYMSAAELNDIYSQYKVGFMYYNGEGVAKDLGKASEWFLKAAKQGNLDAQYSVGVMYHEGKGLAQDYQEALKWLNKAADSGSADAQYNLGFMYLQGQGVTADYDII